MLQHSVAQQLLFKMFITHRHCTSVRHKNMPATANMRSQTAHAGGAVFSSTDTETITQ